MCFLVPACLRACVCVESQQRLPVRERPQSSDTMTDEDKEATIKNGRGLFSDGPLWARARRRARNGEKRRDGLASRRRTGL